MQGKFCFKISLRNFADHTTIHGFRDFYYSKSLIMQIFWAVVLSGALCLTVYHISQSVINYQSQPTMITFETVNQKEMRYPDLMICYPHWIYWLNWTQVERMGFSRQETLVGMSHLSTIYSRDYFDRETAQRGFVEKMARNNFTTLSEFYKVSARITPNRLYDYSDRDRRILNFDLKFLGKTGHLCYVVPGVTFFNFTPMDLFEWGFSMSLRPQLANGDVLYENGDHTRIPAPLANCKRKMKHFLNGLLLDNLPSSFTNDAKVACTDPLWSYTDHPEFDIFAKFDKEEISCVPITSTMQSPGWTTIADVNLHVTFESGAESDIMLFNAKTDAGSLVGVICSEFSLLPRQVDRIVYLSEYDCSLSFPSDFQNCTGILIFLVEIDEKSASKSCTPTSRIASSNDLEQLYITSAGTNRFWKTILKQPEMFRRNGVIYKMLSKDQTLVDGYHYSITSLMEYAFVYCKLKNRFEICINKVGHFEANDRLEDDLLRRQTLTNETNIMNALIDLNKPTPTYPYSSSVMNFKDNYQMCYFLKK